MSLNSVPLSATKTNSLFGVQISTDLRSIVCEREVKVSINISGRAPNVGIDTVRFLNCFYLPRILSIFVYLLSKKSELFKSDLFVDDACEKNLPLSEIDRLRRLPS